MNADEEELISLLALMKIPGIGNMTAKALCLQLGSAQKVFNTPKGKLLAINGVGAQTVESIFSNKSTAQDWAKSQLELCAKNNVSVISQNSEFYPSTLKKFQNAPFILFAKGELACLKNNKMVAVVGTRNATTYGKKITEEISKELALNNITVVSGLAYGIDIVAHKATLAQNHKTIAVMGGGLNHIYPSAHQNTAIEITKNGCLLSEYPIGVKPDPSHFPERNRIVAGMCAAIIVVEAASKGGALITAEYGNEYSKEVYAVPGKIGDTYSEGCLLLVKNHKASIFISVNEMIKDLNWDNNKTTIKEQPAQKLNLSDKEQKVFDVLSENGSVLIDELAWKTQINVNELASILLKLEFDGIVKPKPGKKFELMRR